MESDQPQEQTLLLFDLVTGRVEVPGQVGVGTGEGAAGSQGPTLSPTRVGSWGPCWEEGSADLGAEGKLMSKPQPHPGIMVFLLPVPAPLLSLKLRTQLIMPRLLGGPGRWELRFLGAGGDQDKAGFL